jgi:hypothetical protein
MDVEKDWPRSFKVIKAQNPFRVSNKVLVGLAKVCDDYQYPKTIKESLRFEDKETGVVHNILNKTMWVYGEKGNFFGVYWCKEDVEDDSRLGNEKLVAEDIPRSYEDFKNWYNDLCEDLKDDL